MISLACAAALTALAVVFLGRCSEPAELAPGPQPDDSAAERAETQVGAASSSADRRSMAAFRPDEVGEGPESRNVGTALLILRTLTAEGERLDGCRLTLRPAKVVQHEVTIEYPATEKELAIHVVEDLPVGEYDVVAQVPTIEETLAFVSWQGRGKQEVDVTVARRTDLLGGIVQDFAGRAIAGAIVSPANSNTPRATVGYGCVTDARGRFVFRRATGYTHQQTPFQLSDDLGQAGIADSAYPIDLAWGNLQHVIAASGRAAVDIRVVDMQGVMIERFSVEARSQNTYGTVTKSAIASNGSARVVGLPTGRAALLIVPNAPCPPIWGEVMVAPDGGGFASFIARRAVRLEGIVEAAGARESAITASIRPATVVAGERKPDELGLRLTSKPAPSFEARQVVRDGKFEFWCDPSCEYLLRVEAAGYMPVETRVQSRHGSFDTISVILQAQSRLRTRLSPPEVTAWLQSYVQQQQPGDRRKIGSFLLVNLAANGAAEGTLTATPSADGTLEFAGVSEGTWLLRVVHPLERSDLLETIRVGKEPLVELPPVNLERLRPGRVEGRLRWDPVSLRPRIVSAMADGGGRLSVPIRNDGTFGFDVPGGVYRLAIGVIDTQGDTALLRESRAVEVAPGLTTSLSLEVALRRLDVRIVDERTGKGVVGVTLSIDEERATQSFRTAKTDGTGTAVIYPCPLGEFGLSIQDVHGEKWTFLTRVLADATNPLIVRVPQ